MAKVRHIPFRPMPEPAPDTRYGEWLAETVCVLTDPQRLALHGFPKETEDVSLIQRNILHARVRVLVCDCNAAAYLDVPQHDNWCRYRGLVEGGFLHRGVWTETRCALCREDAAESKGVRCFVESCGRRLCLQCAECGGAVCKDHVLTHGYPEE